MSRCQGSGSGGGAGALDTSPPRHLDTSPRRYTSLFDFCERVLGAGARTANGKPGPSVLNKATIEALVRCGAMDCLHGRQNRAAMLATVEAAMTAAQKTAADKAAGQGGLFLGGGGAGGGGAAKPVEVASLARVGPWPEGETLQHEKEALGFYVSSHPLERWRRWASVFITATTETAKQLPQDGRIVMAGLVQSVRTIIVKNGRSAGQKMAIVVFEDTLGTVEAVMFADCYAQFGHLLQPDAVLFVLGRVDRSRAAGGSRRGANGGAEGDENAPTENTVQIVVDRVVPVEGVPLMPGRLWLLVDGQRLNGSGESAIAGVAEIVAANAPAGDGVNGTMPDRTTTFPVDLVVDTPTQRVRLEAGPTVRVQPTPELISRIAEMLGEGCIRVVGGVSVEMTAKNDRPKWAKRAG